MEPVGKSELRENKACAEDGDLRGISGSKIIFQQRQDFGVKRRPSPHKKPDSDNIAKVVADALNGIAYDDDAQIADLTVIKRYTENPCVKVTIAEISHDL